MRYFLDTEFIESGPHKPIQLISIGIVAEDGRTFYAVSRDFNPDDASDWVKANVLPQIRMDCRTSIESIRKYLLAFFEGRGKPEFWGYYADYDWVVFCQIFGSMVDLPKGWPMYCRDLKQWCDDLGNPQLPEQSRMEHNALNDALWNQTVYEFLSRRTVLDARRMVRPGDETLA